MLGSMSIGDPQLKPLGYKCYFKYLGWLGREAVARQFPIQFGYQTFTALVFACQNTENRPYISFIFGFYIHSTILQKY